MKSKLKIEHEIAQIDKKNSISLLSEFWQFWKGGRVLSRTIIYVYIFGQMMGIHWGPNYAMNSSMLSFPQFETIFSVWLAHTIIPGNLCSEGKREVGFNAFDSFVKVSSEVTWPSAPVWWAGTLRHSSETEIHRVQVSPYGLFCG